MRWLPPGVASSCHATQGTVGLVGSSEPAVTFGFSAFALPTLLSEQASRSSFAVANAQAVELPTGIHLPPRSPWAGSGTNLEAKTRWFSGATGVAPPAGSSYQTTHGTVLLAPVKAMSGWTAS